MNRIGNSRQVFASAENRMDADVGVDEQNVTGRRQGRTVDYAEEEDLAWR